MHIGFRWYGEGNDTVSLDDIRQIPGVETIVWSLQRKPAGLAWSSDEIHHALHVIESLSPSDEERGITRSFNGNVVESVNVHESIKSGKTVLGLSRDEALDHYRTTIANLGKAGIKVVTYNFMPVFDWLRTDLYHPLPDGSTAMYYDAAKVSRLTDPSILVDRMLSSGGKLTLTGWEPERLAHLPELITAYEGMTRTQYLKNYQTFLDAVIPVCEKYDVRLAVHPDDPSFDLFGWPRVVSTQEGIKKVLSLNSSQYNGLCLCIGSFSSRKGNDAVQAVHAFMDRIYFTHVRNIKFTDPQGSFTEVACRASEGDVDTASVMREYAEHNYQWYIRPDHGRHLWNENELKHRPRPGYGLYDRALSIQYILGLWDAFRMDIEGRKS